MSNTNKSATVAKTKNFHQLNKALIITSNCSYIQDLVNTAYIAFIIKVQWSVFMVPYINIYITYYIHSSSYTCQVICGYFRSRTNHPDRSHLKYSVPSAWAGPSSGAATLFRIKLSTDTGFLLRPPTERGRCSSASTKSPCKQLMGNHKYPPCKMHFWRRKHNVRLRENCYLVIICDTSVRTWALDFSWLSLTCL